MSGKINCTILTPEKILYDGDVDSGIIQAFDGKRGFLHNHAALVAELGIGEVRLKSGGADEFLLIEGGIAEIKANKLIILAENAFSKQDLDKSDIENRLKQLEERKSNLAKFSPDMPGIILEQTKLKARLKTASR